MFLFCLTDVMCILRPVQERWNKENMFSRSSFSYQVQSWIKNCISSGVS